MFSFLWPLQLWLIMFLILKFGDDLRLLRVTCELEVGVMVCPMMEYIGVIFFSPKVVSDIELVLEN